MSDFLRAEHYRRQLETVAQNATLALFIMDEHQQCTYMNPAAEQLTGYSLAEVVGKPLHDYVHHTRPDGTPYPLEECPIDQAFPQNMREQGEEVFVHKDGHFYPVAFTASPILQEGLPVGTIIEARNISDERRARREAALTVAVGEALTHGGSLREVLQRCTEAVVEQLDAAFARVWTLNEAEQILELQASAGMYTHLDGPHGRVPVGKFKIGLIAQELTPHLSNDVVNDPRVGDHEWARREGMKSFAGYPLLVEGRAVGVLAMFARRVLPKRTLGALGAIADGIALAIDRNRAETGRTRLLLELEVERARLATVFREAPAFIATVRGPDHVFEMANPPYYQLVGHRDILNKPVAHALPEVVDQGFVGLLDRVYSTGEPFIGTEVPVLLQIEPGEPLQERFVNFVYQPLQDAEGRVSGILVHGVEVTDFVESRRRVEEQASELEAQAEELQQINEEREQAITARSRFYAVMSHELRTPINAILGYNDLLLGEVFGALPNGAQESMERAQKATRHLLELVNDVLDLSKLESGKVEISSEPVLISELLDELLATVQPLAESRGTVLEIQAGDCVLPVTTDPRRLRQILLNLVSNAIKFGEGRPVRIGCRIGDDGWMELEVADQGAGIAPEDLPRIFDEFVQLSNAGAEGTGLGLPISKRLAGLLGGDLEAMSEPGAGSVFRLRLPAREVAIAAPSS